MKPVTWLATSVAVLVVPCLAPARADRDIVYAARYYNPPGARGTSHSHLYRINPDGTARTRITSGNHDDDAPCWSPDGRWIAYRHDAYGRADSVRVCDPQGHRARTIWASSKATQECTIGWSADSRAVLVTVGDWRTPEDWVNTTWCIPVNGGARTRLANLGEIAWSPDGRRLFRSYRAATPRALPKDVVASGLRDRGTPVRSPLEGPAWLNNRTLAGFQNAGEVAPTVVCVDIDGRERRRVSFAGLVSRELAAHDYGSWWMLGPDTRSADRLLCAKSGGHVMGGGREQDYVVVTVSPPRMTWLCKGDGISMGEGGRYCVVGLTDLAPYGAKREVYVAPLQVGSTAGGPPRTIVGGLVWVRGADWRKAR